MYQWCINNNKAELIVVTWDKTEFVMLQPLFTYFFNVSILFNQINVFESVA